MKSLLVSEKGTVARSLAIVATLALGSAFSWASGECDRTTLLSYTRAAFALPGEPAEFRVEACGKNLQFQWYALRYGRDFEAISGATNATLVLHNPPSESYWYAALVHGDNGTAYTGPIDVVTLRNTPSNEVETALDTADVPFYYANEYNWFAQTAETADGHDALETPLLLGFRAYPHAELVASIQGPALVEFDAKNNGRAFYDAVVYTEDGMVVVGAGIAGTEWGHYQFAVPAGRHWMRWSASGSGVVEFEAGVGWVDRVRVVPGVQRTLTLTPTDDTYSWAGTVHGKEPRMAVSRWDRSYVKFGLGALDGTVAKAILRVLRTEAWHGAAAISAYQVGDSWSENQATFPEQGAYLGTVFSEQREWLEFDVTGHVKMEQANDGTVSLQLASNLDQWTSLSSKEGEAAPELVITAVAPAQAIERFEGVGNGAIPEGWSAVRFGQGASYQIGVATPIAAPAIISPTRTPLLRHLGWSAAGGGLIRSAGDDGGHYGVRTVFARGPSNLYDSGGCVTHFTSSWRRILVFLDFRAKRVVVDPSGSWKRFAALIPDADGSGQPVDVGEFWTLDVEVQPGASAGTVRLIVQAWDEKGRPRIGAVADQAGTIEADGAWVLEHVGTTAQSGGYGTFGAINEGGGSNTGLWFDSIERY